MVIDLAYAVFEHLRIADRILCGRNIVLIFLDLMHSCKNRCLVILVNFRNWFLGGNSRFRAEICFLLLFQAYLLLSILFKSFFSLVYSNCRSIHSYRLTVL